MSQNEGLRAVLDLLFAMERSAPLAVCSICAGMQGELVMRWQWVRDGKKKDFRRSVLVSMFEKRNLNILDVIGECGRLITLDQDAPQ